ncbi:hypothetical protein [Streptomyces sp. Root264]|uniref:hypothetical protein n=1 Tax=Streptomyces sp. Root264 TaxID=1736503 RepID=UPI00099E468F|nr:hypothetical protein [Streptomyces sp. Root264]
MSTVNSNPDPTITDQQVKHLEFIQAIVTRLGNGSFLIKGWTLTAAGVFFAVLSKNLSWKVAVTGFLPIIGFWLLDSYYLRQERLFRKLYDAVRLPGSTVQPFSMNVGSYHSSVPWMDVIKSHTMRNFYGTLALVNLVFLVGGVIKDRAWF